MTVQVIGGVVAAKWYEVDSFVSYLGSRISGSWDLGVGRQLEGKESQMTDLTDLAGWTDGRAVGWERKRFREGMVWRGEMSSVWPCWVSCISESATWKESWVCASGAQERRLHDVQSSVRTVGFHEKIGTFCPLILMRVFLFFSFGDQKWKDWAL